MDGAIIDDENKEDKNEIFTGGIRNMISVIVTFFDSELDTILLSREKRSGF